MLRKFISKYHPLLVGLGICLGFFIGVSIEDAHIGPISTIANSYIKVLNFVGLAFVIISLFIESLCVGKTHLKELLKKAIILFLAFLFLFYAFCFATSQIFSYHMLSLPYANPSYYFDPSSYWHQLSSFLQALTSASFPSLILSAILFTLAFMSSLSSEQALPTALKKIQSAIELVYSSILFTLPLFIPFCCAKLILNLDYNAFYYLHFYLLAFALLAIFLIFFLFPQLLKLTLGIRKRKLLYYFSLPLSLSFFTGSILASLPLLISRFNKLNTSSYGQEKMNLPAIFLSIPNLKAALGTLFIIYASFIYQHPLELSTYLKIAFFNLKSVLTFESFGGSGIPFMLSVFDLPMDSYSLYLKSLPYTEALTSSISLCAILSISLLCAANPEKGLPSISLPHTFKALFIPLMIFGGLIWGIKTQLPELHYRPEINRGYALDPSVEVELIREFSKIPNTRYFVSSVEDIQKKGVLRAGYLTYIPPFSFQDDVQNQVGLDIAMAYRLAKQLEVKLQLIPYPLEKVTEFIEEGIIDIAMSGLAITPERMRYIAFSDPYHLPSNALVILDNKRGFFRDYFSFKDKELNIAVLKESSLEKQFALYFPKSKRVLLNHINEFTQKENIDALFWKYEQAQAFCLENPQFCPMIPTPSIGREMYAYGVHKDAGGFLGFLNQWLEMIKISDKLEQEKQVWFGINQQQAPARWRLL